jgi:hypothetical protein
MRRPAFFPAAIVRPCAAGIGPRPHRPCVPPPFALADPHLLAGRGLHVHFHVLGLAQPGPVPDVVERQGTVTSSAAVKNRVRAGSWRWRSRESGPCTPRPDSPGDWTRRAVWYSLTSILRTRSGTGPPPTIRPQTLRNSSRMGSSTLRNQLPSSMNSSRSPRESLISTSRMVSRLTLRPSFSQLALDAFQVNPLPFLQGRQVQHPFGDPVLVDPLDPAADLIVQLAPDEARGQVHGQNFVDPLLAVQNLVLLTDCWITA